MEVRQKCPACGGDVTGPEPRLESSGIIECPHCGMEIPRDLADNDDMELLAPSKKQPSRPQLLPVKFDKQRRNVIDDEMDMTPMVDVTFLLLIFFMVTAAFSLQRAFEVPAPDKDQPTTNQVVEIEEDPDFVTIRIDAYNTYYVSTSEWEKEAPSEQELRVRLRDAVRGGSEGVVPTKLLVKAHGNAFLEKVVTALDAGAELGMREVKLTTVEEDE